MSTPCWLWKDKERLEKSRFPFRDLKRVDMKNNLSARSDPPTRDFWGRLESVKD